MYFVYVQLFIGRSEERRDRARCSGKPSVTKEKRKGSTDVKDSFAEEERKTSDKQWPFAFIHDS